MVNFILERIERRESGVVLMPRGHAKTTWGNTILLSWLLSRNSSLRVGLVSNTSTQAEAFSRAIRWTLGTNARQQEIFGDLTGPVKWTDSEWITKGSPLHGTKDVSCYAVGTGGPIISKRFDLILADDILDEENTATRNQREKVETWFWKTLRPCLAPGGSVIVLGTRWAEGDLYEQLINEKKWPTFVRSAIEDGQALWPELWPLERLEQEREAMGSALFACSYLNDVSGLQAGNVFRREWFRYFDVLPEGNYTWRMGVDLAVSTKERADWTARVVTATNERTKDIYVVSVARTKTEAAHQAFIGDGYAAFPLISSIVVESNQFASALVQHMLAETNWPIIGRRSDHDKLTRARAVAARYESGKIYHHRSLAGSDFEIELLSFPKGHDDWVDALGFASDVRPPSFVFGTLFRRNG